MFLLYSVEGNNRSLRWSQGAVVGVLVGLAIYTNLWAFHRVSEIRRNIAFQEQLRHGLDELTAATEAIAAARRAEVAR
jgi:hypothetical protein